MARNNPCILFFKPCYNITPIELLEMQLVISVRRVNCVFFT